MQHNVDEATQSIAHLNDQARTTLTNCKLIITQGIDLLGNDAVDRILHLVMRFDDFSVQRSDSGILWAEKVRYECATHNTAHTEI